MVRYLTLRLPPGATTIQVDEPTLLLQNVVGIGNQGFRGLTRELTFEGLGDHVARETYVIRRTWKGERLDLALIQESCEIVFAE